MESKDAHASKKSKLTRDRDRDIGEKVRPPNPGSAHLKPFRDPRKRRGVIGCIVKVVSHKISNASW